MYTIYLLQNKLNKKCYVGKTNNHERRMNEHKSLKNTDMVISRAIKKYGWGNFTKRILEENVTVNRIESLEEMYQALWDTLKNGYNVFRGSRGTGMMSDETKRKLSESKKGKKASEEILVES